MVINIKKEKYIMTNDFNAEEVMNMSRDELIDLLGPEKSALVKDGIEKGTLDFSEFKKLCLSSFKYPQQGTLVRDCIFLQLSDSECFNMFESDPKKQATYARMTELRDKAKRGELTRSDLKYLCDQVFKGDPELSQHVQNEFIKAGRVKDNEPLISSEQQPRDENNTWSLTNEQKENITRQEKEVANNPVQNQPMQPVPPTTQLPQQPGLSQMPPLPQNQPLLPMTDVGGMEI
jgi:hypothetical protein